MNEIEKLIQHLNLDDKSSFSIADQVGNDLMSMSQDSNHPMNQVLEAHFATQNQFLEKEAKK